MYFSHLSTCKNNNLILKAHRSKSRQGYKPIPNGTPIRQINSPTLKIKLKNSHMNSLVVGLALPLVAVIRSGRLIRRRWRRRGVRRRRSLRWVRRRLRVGVRRRRGVHVRSSSIWDRRRHRGQKSGRHGRDGDGGGDHEDQHAASGQVLLTTHGRRK